MISVERSISASELIDTMYQITLAQDKSVMPYEHASILIEEMGLDDFIPTTLYVLKNGVRFQNQLRQDLLVHGHDSLRLDGALHLSHPTGSVGLVPPMVEDDPDHGPCLIDGAHRVYMARSLGIEAVKVLRIRNPLPSAPIYAHPNQWNEIVEYDETPADPALKKRYRDNPRSLYRDFSSLNGSTMRESRSN